MALCLTKWQLFQARSVLPPKKMLVHHNFIVLKFDGENYSVRIVFTKQVTTYSHQMTNVDQRIVQKDFSSS